MCVSRDLHRFIATTYLPTKFYGVAVREENCHARSWTISVCWDIFEAGINLDLPAEINMSKITNWLDYCNGLLLLWHSGGKSLPRYYIVINPLTKQSVTVDKPLAKSRDRDYAVLAYDAALSKYFKIVRFETSTHMKVFFSETVLYPFKLLLAVNNLIYVKTFEIMENPLGICVSCKSTRLINYVLLTSKGDKFKRL
ncbi:hypothetical protein ACFE04_009905 [Oxalis oulophora]